MTSYTVVSDPSTADMTITFQQIAAAPAGGDTLGNCDRQVVVSTNQIISAKMNMNYWAGMTDDEALNGMKATAAHEYGHALGIGGHSPVYTDIMNAATPVAADKSVSSNDINTVKSDYTSMF